MSSIYIQSNNSRPKRDAKDVKNLGRYSKSNSVTLTILLLYWSNDLNSHLTQKYTKLIGVGHAAESF